MASIRRRIGQLETKAWAAERAQVQAQLAAMTDAELEAVIAGGDPGMAPIVRAMSDEELEILATSPPGKAERFFERMAAKYAGVVCEP